MTRKEIDVVVSRFDENTTWVHRLPEHAQAIVYNSGTDLHYGTPISNLGGNPQVFVHHMMAVYNKMSNYESDYIAFLNGNPFASCPDVIEQISAKIYTGSDFYALGKFKHRCKLDGTPQHAGLDVRGFGTMVLERSLPEELTFTEGGQFIIHKRVLLRHPIQFFWKLFVNSVQNPQVKFILERTWKEIFDESAA